MQRSAGTVVCVVFIDSGGALRAAVACCGIIRICRATVAPFGAPAAAKATVRFLECSVPFLLRISRLIDWINERVGRSVMWLVLIAVVISAGNALVRKLFNTSSNALLEIQWYLFGLIFLSCSGYTLLRNEHIRIDVLSCKFSKRAQTWFDIFGILFFLMPMAIAIMVLSWPVFVSAFDSGEMSNSEGGLIVWPARFMIPAGFFLLIMQAVSELIKRIGFLLGMCPDPTEKKNKLTPEEELALAIKAQKEGV